MYDFEQFINEIMQKEWFISRAFVLSIAGHHGCGILVSLNKQTGL